MKEMTGHWSRVSSRDNWHLGRAPPWSSSSVLDHSSLPPVFESQHGHIWRLFHLWLRFITFEGCLAHLAYLVHKVAVKHQSSEQVQSGWRNHEMNVSHELYSQQTPEGCWIRHKKPLLVQRHQALYNPKHAYRVPRAFTGPLQTDPLLKTSLN